MKKLYQYLCLQLHIPIIPVVLFLLLLIGACGIQREWSGGILFDLKGTVTDKTNGSPIEGVTMRLELKYNEQGSMAGEIHERQTNSDGQYFFNTYVNCGPNHIQKLFVIPPEGYSGDMKHVRCTAESQEFNFQLVPLSLENF